MHWCFSVQGQMIHHLQNQRKQILKPVMMMPKIRDQVDTTGEESGRSHPPLYRCTPQRQVPSPSHL